MFVLFAFISIFLGVFVVFLCLEAFEYTWCIQVRRQIPFKPSSRRLRRATVNAINEFYPNAKSVCEIGAGYGGLASYIARKCKVSVCAIENMPFTSFVSRFFCLFFGGQRVKNVCADAFSYLDKSDMHFDIGVAYLGPKVNNRLLEIKSHFDVLIVLDVPIDNVKPMRVVDVGGGSTVFVSRQRCRTEFPHKLFIYEL